MITQLSSEKIDSSFSSEILSFPVKDKEVQVSITDVLGMTAREAASLFSAKNIPFKIKGSGVVKSLASESRDEYTSSQLLIIHCEPR
jgi:hypothetical protein